MSLYIIDKDQVLDIKKVIELVQNFNTYERPKLVDRKNYYDGKQKITTKVVEAERLKPTNRIVVNYCKNIVDNYNGYITGRDITYSSDVDIEPLQNILNYNDVSQEDSEFLKQALIYGVAYECCYIDQDGQQRFGLLDSRDCFAVYDNTIEQNLVAVIRYYLIDSTQWDSGYYVEVYYNGAKTIYRTNSQFSSFELVGGENYYYNQIPIIVFQLNKDGTNIFDCIRDLQDAYNTLTSSEVDDFESFCDAYLVLKGVFVDEDWLQRLKGARVIDLGQGQEQASADYLTKNIADTQIENMLTNVKNNIHKISGCPDFADDSFGTSSGIAMRYKLLNFENNSGQIEKQMTKALQKRLELICSIMRLTDVEMIWRDIQITFARNLPVDLADIANSINQFRGLVSDKTLLAQVPFVQDVDMEYDQAQEEKKQNMGVYNFGVLDGENTETE